MLARRTRVVSFRLSEDEYKDLMNLCLSRGSRSLSDFARLATFSQIECSVTNGDAESSIQQLYRKLSALDGEVKRLAKVVDASEDSLPDIQAVAAS
jgi:hypothetical protein